MVHSLFLFYTLIAVGCALPWNGAQQTLESTSTATWTPAPTGDSKVDLEARRSMNYSDELVDLPIQSVYAGGKYSAINDIGCC